MIVDSFMFCRELDMLELRLRLMYDYVDKFVILESGWTHANELKPFYFDENRFEWAADKIDYYANTDTVPLKNDFDVEMFQRQMLYNYSIKDATEEDIILSSDIDEIPSRENLEKLRTEPHYLPFKYGQDLYYYNSKTPMNKVWFGTIATRPGEHNVQRMRSHKEEMPTIRGGWHFTYFMDNEGIRRKLRSFSHHKEYGRPPYNTDEHLNKHRENKTNFLNKKGGDVDPLPLPEYLIKELERFPQFTGEA